MNELIYTPSDLDDFRKKSLVWAACSDTFMYLNGNGHQQRFGNFPELLAVDVLEEIAPDNDRFNKLHAFVHNKNDWFFGFMSYELKNDIEALKTSKTATIEWPKMYFFRPRYLLSFEKDHIKIRAEAPEDILGKIQKTEVPDDKTIFAEIASRTNRATYHQLFERLKQHIVEGDIYEINFCMEFYANGVVLEPVITYMRLVEDSPMPFSTFFKHEGKYCMSASPERFISISDRKILSQPMKGTIKRGQTPQEDEKLKETLRNSEKEKAENLMIVDLVRNDLAKSCKPGTVKVDELFGIYTYPRVHQMISTISGVLEDNTPDLDSVKNAFPMGSMTGAPKIRAMQLIDALEPSARSLFSGTAGYISPNGDIDLNVLIRSLFYDVAEQKLSFHVGSAITFDADAEEEYEECILKASSIFKALNCNTYLSKDRNNIAK